MNASRWCCTLKGLGEGRMRLPSFSSGSQLEPSDPPSPSSHAASSLLRNTSGICWATQKMLLQRTDCGTWVVCVSCGLQTLISKNCSANITRGINRTINQDETAHKKILNIVIIWVCSFSQTVPFKPSFH